jgi:hypothetical protein
MYYIGRKRGKNMRKIIVYIVFGIVILSGLGANAVSKSIKHTSTDINEIFTFSPPTPIETEQYLTIHLEETNQFLQKSGKPEMPMVSYSWNVPFGAKNIKILVTPSNEIELDIEKKVKPSPQIVTFDNTENIKLLDVIEDRDTYLSNERYPKERYETKITAGLYKNHRYTHISLYLFPVQYSPIHNKIYYITEASVTISYDPPIQRSSYEDEYDLVIIAPSKFEGALQSLVDHKNSIDVKTYMKTTEEIYYEYTGYDKPEQIKYFIKNAIETNNISYVLLAGGLKKLLVAKDREDCNQGSKAWHLPARYTNIRKSGLNDPGALSDLYYADIYDGEGNFSSWDSNGDGVYAKWGMSPGTDTLDLNPDVYVGRIPCRNSHEVKTVVNKIIHYETTIPTSESWFKRMIGISGLSHDLYNGQPDGEYLTDLGFSYVEDVIDEEIRVYASNEGSDDPIPVRKDIIKAFSKGARFVFLSGHGHPIRWATHPVDNIDEWMQGLTSGYMWKLFNNKKLPIVVVGGCHDAQFNITWLNTLRAGKEEFKWYWTHGEPGAHCFCYKLLIIPLGGAIASIGGTGLTTSLGGQPNSGNSKLATDFFYEIGQNDATTFGEAFAGTLQKFIDENTIGLWEGHVLTIWNAIGDPSLKLS